MLNAAGGTFNLGKVVFVGVHIPLLTKLVCYCVTVYNVNFFLNKVNPIYVLNQ